MHRIKKSYTFAQNSSENSVFMKHIYLFFALVATLLAQPLYSNEKGLDWQDDREGVESEVAAITIEVQGNQIHITNAAGMEAEIFNITGTRIAVVGIDSDDKTLRLNLKGCFFIKVGKVVRKIYLR